MDNMNVAMIGPAKMNDSLLKWVTFTLERVHKYGWTLLIPDEPGVGQLCALVADARGMDYTIYGFEDAPQIISYAGNYKKLNDEFWLSKSRNARITETIRYAELIIVIQNTPEYKDIESAARLERKLLIKLSK